MRKFNMNNMIPKKQLEGLIIEDAISKDSHKVNALRGLGILNEELAKIIIDANGIENVNIQMKENSGKQSLPLFQHKPMNILPIQDIETGVNNLNPDYISMGLTYGTDTNNIKSPFQFFYTTPLSDFDTLTNAAEVSIRQGTLEDIFYHRSINILYQILNTVISDVSLSNNIHTTDLFQTALDLFKENRISDISDIINYMPDHTFFFSDTIYDLVTPYIMSLYNYMLYKGEDQHIELNRFCMLLNDALFQMIDILRYEASEIYFPKGGLPPVMREI